MSEESEKKKLIVVGNGMVSWRFCSSLLDKGALQKYAVTVIGEEPRPAYDRVHLTDYFDSKDASQLELASAEWYQENGIDLLTGVRVDSLDRTAKKVSTSSGQSYPYDRLVFATGSKPFVPPIEGKDLPGVFVYRTIEDVQAIEAYAQNCRSAAVIGGGLLGLEAADVLRKMNLQTHIIEAANGLMPRQLNEEGAEVLHAEVALLGITLHLKKLTKSIQATESGLRIEFNDGGTLDVGMLVISAGIRPNGEVAAEAGLACSAPGGIMIGDNLRTGDPSIYAIGECASHRGVIYGLVAPGYKMADTLADRLSGGKELFQEGDLSCRLKLLGVDVATFGEFNGAYSQYAHHDSGKYRMLNVHQGRLVGATVVGPWEKTAAVEHAVREKVSLGERELKNFQATGDLPSVELSESLLDWPDNAVVCNCTNTTCATLKCAMRDGATTLDALQKETGAGTVCASCVPLLAQMVGVDSQEIADKVRPRGKAILWATGIIALAACLAFMLYPGLPAADSVQSSYYQLTKIWQEKLTKQITGYSLAGISVLSLVISLRKRVKWINFGNYGWWRALHTSLGTLTLVFLFFHTGFHGGENLNLWLFICFVALNTAGAMTAFTVAKDSSSLLGRRMRSLALRFHLIFLWPYPLLLGFHIAKTYLY